MNESINVTLTNSGFLKSAAASEREVLSFLYESGTYLCDAYRRVLVEVRD